METNRKFAFVQVIFVSMTCLGLGGASIINVTVNGGNHFLETGQTVTINVFSESVEDVYISLATVPELKMRNCIG